MEARDTLEKEINDAASEICPFSGKILTSFEKSVYLRLVENVYRYCRQYLLNAPIYKNGEVGFYFNVEIWEILKKGLENFNPDNGNNFIFYFNAGIKAYLPKARRYLIVEREKGSHMDMPHKRMQKIYRIVRCVDLLVNSGKIKPDYKSLSADVLSMIARSTGLTKEDVEQNLYYYDILKIKGEKIIDKQGNEISLFDVLIDDTGANKINNGAIEKLFTVIEILFNALPEAKKPYMQKLLTVELFDSFTNNNFSFIDREIIEKYRQTGKLPSKREIAIGFGRGKDADGANADATMTLKRFFEKVRKELKKENLSEKRDFLE